MEMNLRDNQKVIVLPFEDRYFSKIQQLNKEEGWTNLVENNLNTLNAWRNSNVALVVVREDGEIIGYIRGFTDAHISLFICEMLVDKNYRGYGIGKQLITYVHNLYPKTRIEMLANRSSRTFYERQGFRGFYGFRKTLGE
ncbi:GNAT family N-acetyltransferase [Rossellomorea aquimaris]|uniref:GNAT family N-acetyltransferase n=1 Tax=Rossellomorea aquimaris TaxID=189382 RepID=UPI0007D04E77|nr:GNAT family N-acetyltransferase [Rossellomorea aquimaris]